MKLLAFPTAFLLLLGSAADAAQPVLRSPSQSALYYEIGANPVSQSASGSTRSITLGGGGSGGLGYSCGKFDPKASIRHTLDNIKDEMVQIRDDAVAGIAGIPGYIICRANSLACQMMQGYTARAEEQVRVSIKSCEELERLGQEGGDIVDDWIRISKVEAWREQASQGKPANQAKKAVDRDGGKNGVAWFGGRAGGEGQPPIRPIQDAVRAGYNTLHERVATDTRPLPIGTRSRIGATWPTPDLASAWAVSAVGDLAIRTTDGAQPESTPGIGLLPMVQPELEQTREALSTALSTSAYDPETLTDLSSEAVSVTPELLNSIRRSPMRDWLIDRIASDIALSRVVDRGLLVRRMLLTASDVPEIAAQAPARTRVLDAAARIEDEIDRLMYEREARQKLWSATLAAVLKSGRDTKADTLPTPATPVSVAPGS